MGTTVDFDIKYAIKTVVEGRELTQEQATAAMDAIMTGSVTGAQIGALVTGLRMKGETVSEIAGFAQAMRSHALTVEVDANEQPLLDTCGTGGDNAHSFNISTTATFAIAAAGVRIAKHGNRAASSLCGSADLLEGLGVAVELSPDEVAQSVEAVGIGFMFAPAFHPAMRFVGPSRREMGIRTIFNVLGPLTNPAGAGHQLIGVGHPDIARKLADVLKMLGSTRAVLVHSEEGLDEIGIVGQSAITEWDSRRGTIREYAISLSEFGLERGTTTDVKGGDVATNVAITRSILSGEAGPRRTITLMNAGAGIYAAERADSIGEGIELAAEAIDSGAALDRLNRLVGFTGQLVESRAQVIA
ncbi:MAG: Anthranilate phosphoribosyltransferase [uncultured Thermomicrobiales bacterium]|uniref:Anthranilate phosphoribosyltransferase n=1 Tax=uncultured Thermomicrobiales bacterium TaxID=1645740 RepID=A0A6J4VEP4_9BACT|nr:MAG: Anthranilate phosphoribosyltransferase [uncultured Thermomicrobiales bacterium]